MGNMIMLERGSCSHEKRSGSFGYEFSHFPIRVAHVGWKTEARDQILRVLNEG